MPTRILREGIITSEPVNSLSWSEEVFYRRLISVSDDYGRFSAHPSLIRAACYPLRLNDVSDQDVGKWLAVCAAKGLVRVYEVEGKRFLEIVKFGQRVRTDSKYPPPPDNCPTNDGHLTDKCPSIARVVGGGVEDDKRHVGLTPDAVPPEKKNGHPNHGVEARQVLEFLNEKAGRRYQANRVNMAFILGRLKDGATVTECRQVIVKKCREWGGDEKMDKYLRPATLFNPTKFAQYQGELVADVPRETSEPA